MYCMNAHAYSVYGLEAAGGHNYGHSQSRLRDSKCRLKSLMNSALSGEDSTSLLNSPGCKIFSSTNRFARMWVMKLSSASALKTAFMFGIGLFGIGPDSFAA